jgi:hypothetical protein
MSAADELYDELFDEEERALLAAAATREGIDAELAVARVLVRKAVAAGNVDQARRCVEAVGRLLKLRKELEAPESGDDALGRVLDSLGEELGVRL